MLLFGDMRKCVVYAPKELWFNLKKTLKAEGRTVSSWFRLEAGRKVAVGSAFFGLGLVGLLFINYPSAPAKDYNCSDFKTWAEAQKVFDSNKGDIYGLDKDGDGIACEGLRK